MSLLPPPTRSRVQLAQIVSAKTLHDAEDIQIGMPRVELFRSRGTVKYYGQQVASCGILQSGYQVCQVLLCYHSSRSKIADGRLAISDLTAEQFAMRLFQSTIKNRKSAMPTSLRRLHPHPRNLHQNPRSLHRLPQNHHHPNRVLRLQTGEKSTRMDLET